LSFVIDASATLPWRFEDEATPWTEALLDRVLKGEDVIAPSHWPLEVANGLLIALRRGRVTSEQIQEFVDDLAAFLDASQSKALEPSNRVLAIIEKRRFLNGVPTGFAEG
jgi:hypothetical protein